MSERCEHHDARLLEGVAQKIDHVCTGIDDDRYGVPRYAHTTESLQVDSRLSCISHELSKTVRKMLCCGLHMIQHAEYKSSASPSLSDVEACLALGGAALLLIVAATRRSAFSTGLAVASAPLLYRGITGRWPSVPGDSLYDTQTALGGDRGVHVRESIRVECSISDAYRFWRRLEDLPRFMSHLASVTQRSDRESHWIAAGPAGVTVEWDAEIITEEENRTLAWRSMPGSDVVTAGSVNFEPVREGRSTQLRVHLQYAPPAGRAGALIASLFGREPSQTIREDLRHFKQLLEAGEIPRATAVTKE